ncbi:RNA-binding domain-containing protein [[Eubacterium] cellulosolvens]
MNERTLGKVVSIELSAIAHATESLEAVEKAMRNVLPPEIYDNKQFTRRYLKGHHGNPITTLNLNIIKKDEIKLILENVFQLMDQAEKDKLKLEFENFLDDKENLYIRLDKQEAFGGTFTLASKDPVRLKIKTAVWHPTPQKVREIFDRLGMSE